MNTNCSLNCRDSEEKVAARFLLFQTVDTVAGHCRAGVPWARVPEAASVPFPALLRIERQQKAESS